MSDRALSMSLTDQAARVAQLIAAGRDDDLEGLCATLEAAEALVLALELRIRAVVDFDGQLDRTRHGGAATLGAGLTVGRDYGVEREAQ